MIFFFAVSSCSFASGKQLFCLSLFYKIANLLFFFFLSVNVLLSYEALWANK